MNDERLNPSVRAATLEYLNACALMLKKSAIIADKILPRYMFREDIKEFKSSKIFKYLYTCEVYIEGFTRTAQILLRPSRPP
jgi:hypothetical protein